MQCIIRIIIIISSSCITKIVMFHIMTIMLFFLLVVVLLCVSSSSYDSWHNLHQALVYMSDHQWENRQPTERDVPFWAKVWMTLAKFEVVV